jgi:hypothetical protein
VGLEILGDKKSKLFVDLKLGDRHLAVLSAAPTRRRPPSPTSALANHASQDSTSGFEMLLAYWIFRQNRRKAKG